MSRRLVIAGVAVLTILAVVVFTVTRGSTVPAGIWLQANQDSSSSELELLVFAACRPEGEEIDSITVDEDEESIVIEMWLSVPSGTQIESCEGTPYTIQLEEPLGDRDVLQRNPDGSETPIQENPF